jgi:hypothetical protein
MIRSMKNQGKHFLFNAIKANNNVFCSIKSSGSSSRSPSPRQSSPEVERNRNGRSVSPHDRKQKTEVTPQSETIKGDTVRKWKIRKQLPSSVDADSGETEAPRKRRWGTSQLLPTKKPALVISTDSLKVTHSKSLWSDV